MFNAFTDCNNIIISDEAHFNVNVFVNKQTYRYWVSENPRLKHQKPLHSPKVTGWAEIAKWGIVGPFFFQDCRGRTVSVNSERYMAMLTDFLAPKFQESRGYNRNIWFQLDGATCHTSNESMIRGMFPQKLISQRGGIIRGVLI